MTERITVAALAKELGLGQQEIYKQLIELGLSARKMSATLPAVQADKIREHNVSQRAAHTRRLRQWEQQRAKQKKAGTMTPSEPVQRQASQANVCQCCERRWLCRSPADEAEPLCISCRSHYAKDAEEIERTLARETSHARLYRDDREKAHKQVADSYKEKADAYAARNRWRAALVRVVLDHEPLDDGSGECWCGGIYPCRTWQRLEQVNKGLHRQVEQLAALPPGELENELDGW